jgi:hypothetical protein
MRHSQRGQDADRTGLGYAARFIANTGEAFIVA